MSVADRLDSLAQSVASVRRRTILFLVTAGFVAVYLPLTASTVVFGHYPLLIDIIVVLTTILVSAVICAWNSRRKFDLYQSEANSGAEARGWQLLTLGSACAFIGRGIYAIDQLISGTSTDGIPWADAFLGLMFVCLVGGVLAFPWSSGDSSFEQILLSVAIVIIVVGTILWPLIIGPVAIGEYSDVLNVPTLWMHLIGIFTLTFSALWVMMKGVRFELWGVAATLLAAVGVTVLAEVGYLAFLVAPSASRIPLLFLNGTTSFLYLLITAAALFRQQVQSSQEDEDDIHIQHIQRPAHRWEIILPYTLIVVLLIVRSIMEVFEWRLEYSEPMIFGSVLIVALLMYRQLQLLRYNDRLYEHIANAAIRDGLTGLYNHRSMHEILRTQSAQADRSGWSLAVVFLDVDRFKHYNDTYGHRQGDGLLTSISKLLLDRCRASDYVGRYGGEEFMVIAPDTTAEDACRLGERLRTSIEGTQYVHNGTRSAVTISVGIALYPDDGEQAEDVINRADQAMYQAKSAGRNQTVLFHPA